MAPRQEIRNKSKSAGNRMKIFIIAVKRQIHQSTRTSRGRASGLSTLLRYSRFGFVLPCLACVEIAAFAAEPLYPALRPDPASGWIVTLGGTAQLGPKYDGASTAGFSGMPSLSWRRANEPVGFSSPDDGLDFTLLGNKTFSVGPVASFRSGRYSGSDHKLKGLRDVPWAIEAGAFAEYWPIEDRLRLRAEVRQGFHGHHGIVADLAADWVERFGQFTLSGGPRLALGSSSFMTRNFGIRPGEALANGSVVAFNSTGGLKSIGAGAAVSYEWSSAWTTSAFVKYERLAGEAGRSPIVRTLGQRDQFTFGLGATYSFKIGG